MKFHVFFTEGSESDPFKFGSVEAVETVEAPNVLDAAKLAHSYFGIDEDATGIFVVVPVDECKAVLLETKSVPDFILPVSPKPITPRTKPKSKPKRNPTLM